MKKEIIKSIIFSLVFLGLTILFWYCLSGFFNQPTVKNLIYWAICFWFWSLVTGVYCLVVKNNLFAYLTFLSISFSFLIFFSFHLYYLIGIIIFFLVLILGRAKMMKETRLRIKISINRSFKAGLFLILTFLFLLISLVYYFNPLINLEEIQIPQSWMKFINKPINDLMGGEFLQSPENLIINQFSNLNLQGISQEQIKKFMPKNLSFVPEEDKEEVSEMIYKLANEKINQFIGPYKKYIPLVLAIFLFLFLKGLLFIIKPLVISGGKLLFIILYWTKFIKIGKEMKEAETIRL